jgi:hypothetical protein
MDVLIWGFLMAVLSALSPTGWIIAGITAIIPIVSWWLARSDPHAVHHRPAKWELWFSFAAPLILASIVALVLSPIRYDDARSILRPTILVIWGLELLLLWRHRHNGFVAWICITFACMWIYGVALASTCSFTVVCEPVIWGPF